MQKTLSRTLSGTRAGGRENRRGNGGRGGGGERSVSTPRSSNIISIDSNDAGTVLRTPLEFGKNGDGDGAKGWGRGATRVGKKDRDCMHA